MYEQRLTELGINVRWGRSGEQKLLCPQCSHTRRNRTEPCLSVNTKTGVYNCHHCGWSGSVGDKVTGDSFAGYSDWRRIKSGVDNTPKKVMDRAYLESLVPLDESLLTYFATRAISVETLARFSVLQDTRFIPAEEQKKKVIAFQYINERNETVGIKYRDNKKNFIWAKESTQLPYGIQLAYESPDVVLAEGEMEAMSYEEAGVRGAVSIPSAPPLPRDGEYSPRLEYLDDYWDWLRSRRRVILSPDNDAPGRAVMVEIARRVGKEKCWIIDLPQDCKDANEVLVKYGKEKLKECYDNARPWPIDGIEDAYTQLDAIKSLRANGYPEGWRTEFAHFDGLLRLHPGQVTLVTGIPGHGKSSFIKQLMVSSATVSDTRWLVYSAEEASSSMAISDIYSIKTNKPFFTGNQYSRISDQDIELHAGWISDHFKYISLGDQGVTVDDVLDKAREMVMRHGTNAVVIDNMSTIEGVLPRQGETRHHAVGDMLTKIIRGAKMMGCHIIMIAHPKKMDRVGNALRVPTGYDVGDSSHYFNKPDNGVTVYRNFATGQTEVHIWKVRFRYAGEVGRTAFRFDRSTGRFTPGENTWEDGSMFQGQPVDARFRDV